MADSQLVPFTWVVCIPKSDIVHFGRVRLKMDRLENDTKKTLHRNEQDQPEIRLVSPTTRSNINIDLREVHRRTTVRLGSAATGRESTVKNNTTHYY